MWMSPGIQVGYNPADHIAPDLLPDDPENRHKDFALDAVVLLRRAGSGR
jgi:hypothetical protein